MMAHCRVLFAHHEHELNRYFKSYVSSFINDPPPDVQFNLYCGFSTSKIMCITFELDLDLFMASSYSCIMLKITLSFAF